MGVSSSFGETILVVEDDEDLLEIMTLSLEDEGYEVMRAHDGGEALELVHAKMPDLILLDMKMPRVSGWEFAARYVAAYPVAAMRAPLIVVTAAEHAAVRARDIAAAGYLAKPFTSMELLAEVRRQLLARPSSAATR